MALNLYQLRVQRTCVLALGLLGTIGLSCPTATAQAPGEIEKIDPPVSGWYAKKLVVRGIPIMAHADVSNAALEEAARRIDRQLAHVPDLVDNLTCAGAQVHLIGTNQQTSDLPEFRHMKGKPFDGKLTLDERGRGFSSLHTSASEENLLLLPSDRWDDHRDILTHEFAHTIMIIGCSSEIRERLEAQCQASVAAGRWPGCYAATNMHEFFAELSMWYFGSRGDAGQITPPPSKGALWLRRYDPDAYRLIDDIYSGRLKAGRREFAALRPATEPEGQIRSQRSAAATEILFFNQTDRPAKLYWLDFDGRRKSYGAVPAVDVVGQNTYVGHVWLIEDADEKTLGIFIAAPDVGRAIVGPTGATPATQPRSI